MNRITFLRYLPLLLLIVVVVALPVGAAKRQTRPQFDPRAQEMLRNMSNYLAGLNQFSVHANTTTEFLTGSQMVLVADRDLDVFVQRPNMVRINSSVPDHDRQIVFNGQTLTIYSPDKNYYSTVSAPGTLDETVGRLRARGVELPLGDLLSTNPYVSLMGRARHGYYIGDSLVNGTMTNQLAFRGKGLDWQIWIDKGTTPLPRRVVIIDRQVPGSPRYTANFTSWDASPTFSADTFTFVPPSGAQKIPFVPAPVRTLQGVKRR